MHNQNQEKRPRLRILPAVVILFVASVVFIGWKHIADQTTETPRHKGFSKQDHSLTDPKSIWVITNKRRPLQPKTYVPSDLMVPNIPLRLGKDSEEMRVRAEAGHALEQLVKGAKADGQSLMLASGYRSYKSQVALYNYYVSQQGKAMADSQSARPGYSEHQTGLAVDIEPTSKACEIQACFAETPEGVWLTEHAYTYGFILRYTEDQEATTGYIYEPWHIRYVGKALANQVHITHTATLEDFFGLAKAGKY